MRLNEIQTTGNANRTLALYAARRLRPMRHTAQYISDRHAIVRLEDVINSGGTLDVQQIDGFALLS